MLTENPHVTSARHRLLLQLRDSVLSLGEVRAEIVQDRVNLGGVEAGRSEIKTLPLE